MNFKELLYRARQGDEDAILEIFEMYRPLLIKNALVEGIFDHSRILPAQTLRNPG